MTTDRTVHVYGLRDPRDGQVRYVGRTLNRRTRLAQHMKERETDNPAKDAWIAELVAAGLKPRMVTLQSCSERRSAVIESRWAWEYRDSAFNGSATIWNPAAAHRVSGQGAVTRDVPFTDDEWIEIVKAGVRAGGRSAIQFARHAALHEARRRLQRFR